MKARNALVLIAVVIVVGGVAWFRSAREGTSADLAASAGTETRANPAPGPVESAGDGKSPGTSPGLVVGNPTPAAPEGEAAPQKLPRVVDLGADKCIPCKKMAPILVELRKEYEGRVIVDFIDVWKNPKAGEPYKIRIIPTQIFFDAEGKEVWRHEGFLSKEEFVKKFAEMGVK